MKSTYSVQRDLMIVMRDGVRLAADLYLPPGPGPFPVLLERTPYNKRGTNPADRSAACPVPRSKPEVAAAFALAGYAYLLQDCRGRYGSEGVFSKYVNEHEDGLDTLAWIREQAWCDGRIGTLGLSYSAHVQAALAAGNPAGLAAMFLDSGGFSSAFHSGIRQGGAFELKQLTWAHKHALLSPLTLADAYRKAALQQVDIRAAVGVDPWQPGHSPLAAAPEYEGFVIEQWRHEVFDDYWKSPALYARGHYADWPDVPMVHLTGWFDPYALTATENFMGLAGRKRAPVHLVLGPWTHGQRSVTHAGEVDFGPAATLDGNIAPDYQALRQGWFDRHLKGDPLAADYLHAPVKLFVMGGGSGCRTREGRLDHGGQWRDEQEWPLQRALNLPFYFTPGGAMEHNVPQLHAAALEYDFDPTHPVPTIGGAIASGAPLMNAGAFDQRTTRAIFAAEQPYGPLADRPDVLVFQTEVLREPVEVTGQIVAHLWVSSSAPDTDFTVKLVDVYPPSKDYPDGCAINLAHGILRMRFRESFDQPRLMQPDDIYKIRIPCFPTSNRFAAGHRIRIDISSSNFPHFDINPNTGAPAGTPCTPVVARNRIHLDRDHPSHVVLPVVPR